MGKDQLSPHHQKRTKTRPHSLGTGGRRIDPSRQSIRDVRGVAVGRHAETEVVVRDGAGVVDARRLVVFADVAGFGLGEALLEAIAGCCPRGTVLDHLLDFARRAGISDGGVVAGARTVVVLHEARVADATIGGGDAHAAFRFLHNDCQDEARVNAGAGGDGPDGGFEVGAFFVRVVVLTELGAGDGDDSQVGGPHALEVNPGILRRPVGGGGAVAGVAFVGVGAGARASGRGGDSTALC